MQQINAPKPPSWRDPVRLRAEARRRRLRPILLGLSLLAGALLALPPRGGFDEAISVQLARGEPLAWALFGVMGVTLGYLGVRLWGWQNRVWAVAAFLMIVGLGTIAVTDPFSSTHQETFVFMCGTILMGHLGFFYGYLDYRLLATAALALLAVGLCFVRIGLSERLLIASSLAALNILVYGYLDP